MESAKPIQNRRRMSMNSALGPLSTVETSGSGVIPHIGQLPGPDCRICGCIGQVYMTGPVLGKEGEVVALW